MKTEDIIKNLTLLKEFPFLLEKDTDIPSLIKHIKNGDIVHSYFSNRLLKYVVYYVLYKQPENAFKYLGLDEFYVILPTLIHRVEYKKYLDYFVNKVNEAIAHIDKPILTKDPNLLLVSDKFINLLVNFKYEKYFEKILNGEFILISNGWINIELNSKELKYYFNINKYGVYELFIDIDKNNDPIITTEIEELKDILKERYSKTKDKRIVIRKEMNDYHSIEEFLDELRRLK